MGAEPASATPEGAEGAEPAGAEDAASAGAEPDGAGAGGAGSAGVEGAEPAGAEPVAAESAGTDPEGAGADTDDPDEPVAAGPTLALSGSTAGKTDAVGEEVGWLLGEACAWEAAEPAESEDVGALSDGEAFCAGGSAICVDDSADDDGADEASVACEDAAVLEMISPNPRYMAELLVAEPGEELSGLIVGDEEGVG